MVDASCKAMQGAKKAVEDMSGEIIDGLERRNLELEIVVHNAIHLENLLIEWAAEINDKGKACPLLEGRMLLAVRAIEERRGIVL